MSKVIRSTQAMQRVQVDCVKIKWKAARGRVQPAPGIILVVQDHFTKYCWLRVIPECTADCVVSELICIFRDFGCPSIIHTDNGREFRNKLMEQLLVRLLLLDFLLFIT